MSDASVVHISSVMATPESSDDWTPRQLLCALIGTPMDKGVFIGWLDENGNVQTRRAQLRAGDEIDILRTAHGILQKL